MRRPTAAASIAIFLALIPLHSLASQQQHDVLVRNGRIIDGSGNGWYYGDLAIKDGRIAAIGYLGDDHTATETIDASGKVVAPGFIDVHTHADTGLYSQPLAENFIRNGVTTLVIGNCGGSPLDIGDYFATLEDRGIAVNVAALIGHNSVLRKVKGPIAGKLDETQLDEARAIVDLAMRDGAVGFSTGLIYTPGQWSDTSETIELQRVAARYQGIYVSHMRSESTGILEAIDEALRIGLETNSRVQISHFKLPMDVSARIGGPATTLGRVEAARARGQEVWIDQYPYTASSTTLNVIIPDWVLEDGPNRAREILNDPELVELVLEDMKKSHEVGRGRTDLSYAVIASSRAYPEFGGLNIKEVAQVLKLRSEKGSDVDWKAIPREQWPPVTMTDQYQAVFDIYLKGGASCVYHTMSEADVEKIMASPLVSICSDSGVRRFGSGVPHPRGYGSNARVLGKYIRERGVVSLEEGIRKMTSMPARAFRIPERGLLLEGFWADVVVFDPETVTDHATYADPHQYSTGFTAVITSGGIVTADDTVTGAKPGKAIRRTGWIPRDDVTPSTEEAPE